MLNIFNKRKARMEEEEKENRRRDFLIECCHTLDRFTNNGFLKKCITIDYTYLGKKYDSISYRFMAKKRNAILYNEDYEVIFATQSKQKLESFIKKY